MENLIIKKNEDQRIRYGHLWLFSNEVKALPKISAGELVNVVNIEGRSFGKAFYNPNSLICGRLLKTDEEIDQSFFYKRLKIALDLRKRLFPDSDMYRLCFGESDLLPGLIIDRYGDYLAVQILSFGIEVRKSMIVSALVELYPEIKGIIEKNDTRLREIEGLPMESKVLYGEIPDRIVCSEQEIKLEINLLEGQKTGYFLDQRLNRKFIRSLACGLKVMDCYTNQGGFALNAALGGATYVEAIDSSQVALDCVAANAQLNNLSIATVKADVSDYLNTELDKGSRWGMIILDPPAFAKNRKSIPQAKAGYGKINRYAMKLLEPGGFLISASCSHHIMESVFEETIYREAGKLGRQLKLIYRGQQSPDHPILATLPETRYLKFYVFQVM